jgi:PAS domain S-box-containing protein
MEEKLKEYSEKLEKTVRERTERLRQSEERYRSIVQNIPAIIGTSNRKGDTTFITPNVQQILGYSPEEFGAGGQAWTSNIHPDDKERVNQAYSALFTNGSVFNVEYRYQRPDGKWIWLHDRSTVVYEKDGIEYTDGVITDITERKRIEEDLRAAREQLEYVVSSNPAAILLGKSFPDGSDFMATYISQSVASLLGFEAEELIGQSGAELWETRIPPEDLRQYRAQIPLLWKDGHQTFQYRFLHKDGTYRWIREEEKVIRDSEGQVRDVIGYWTDITERKRLEEELVKSQRLVVIGETARMVGHDLRNPLQGIVGATDVLRKHLGSNADGITMEMLDVLEKDVAYSNKIIIDLLDYSQKPQIVPVETGLKTIIEKSLQMVQVPNDVTVEDQTDDLRIMVDPQIQRVFVNLIKNSYDAMPNGGVLRISSKTSGGTNQISFCDTGAGITDDVLRKLWKEPVTTKAKGLGMGLAISKKIVEAHGGSLLLENGLEHGAVATVRLPTELRLGGE